MTTYAPMKVKEHGGYPVPKDAWERAEWDGGESISNYIHNNVGWDAIPTKIKLYFKYDPGHGWNQVKNNLDLGNSLEHVKNVCGDNAICWADALHYTAMSKTEPTEFLYRFANWYTENLADKLDFQLVMDTIFLFLGLG
jgi:hypothetical protein